VTDPLWPWLALVGLGAYHGINPAMGWLFAVALGIHEGRRAVVLRALVPLALGHGIAIGLTLLVVGGLGLIVPADVLAWIAGGALILWGLAHAFATPRHHFRIGLRTGFAGLGLWSLMMGLAHGAGLMLVPVFARWPGAAEPAHGHFVAAGAALATAAVAVHTLAMIAVAGIVALVVYEYLGVGILRRGWINLDWLWAGGLVAAGGVLIVL